MEASDNTASVSPLHSRIQALMAHIRVGGDLVFDRIHRDFEEIEAGARKKALEEIRLIALQFRNDADATERVWRERGGDGHAAAMLAAQRARAHNAIMGEIDILLSKMSPAVILKEASLGS